MTISETTTLATAVDPLTATPPPVDPLTATPPPVDPSTTPPVVDDADNLDGARKLRQENKNLRERSKTAETELDGARVERDALRRQEIDRIVGRELADVRDFTDRHGDLAEFVGDDGQLDTAAVLAAAQALIGERPHYAAPPVPVAPPTVRPIESLRAGASPIDNPSSPPPSWRTALGHAEGSSVVFVD